MINKLINTEMYVIHMTDIHIPDVGDLAICCNCLEEKKVYERVKVKKNESEIMEWYCEECTPQKMRFDHM